MSPRLEAAVAGSSMRAVASLEAGAISRATIIAMSRTENAIKPDGAQCAEHGGDMTVRQGAPNDDAPPVGRRPIRPGFPVRVIVNRDLVLAPYQSAENDGDA